MTALPPRTHLVERAVEAMGEAGALGATFTARQPPPPGHDDQIGGGPAANNRHVAPTALAFDGATPPAPPRVVSADLLTRAGLVVYPTTGRRRLAEEIGVVQNQILRAMRAAEADGDRSRLIMVTSARPGEGKTFTALNVAASLAGSGNRPVVLIDVDGKQGSLSHLLGIADLPGLRALAADPLLNLNRVLVATAVDHLKVLPYGARASGGPELPPVAAIATAVSKLTAALPNHAVLLDAPPCLCTSDPSTFAPIVGQVLIVVEAQSTQRNEVEAALDMVEACPTLQLLLNKARLTSGDTFGAYSAS